MASTVAEPLERRLATIADVAELTSISYAGSSMIIVEFGLKRDINGAARDVEAAIQAARADLPTTLRSNPSYRQYNPADAPIVVLSLTSDTLTKAQLYDSADSVIQQQLSQVQGVGQITLGGGALPSVRVELQPGKLNSYGIGMLNWRRWNRWPHSTVILGWRRLARSCPTFFRVKCPRTLISSPVSAALWEIKRDDADSSRSQHPPPT